MRLFVESKGTSAEGGPRKVSVPKKKATCSRTSCGTASSDAAAGMLMMAGRERDWESKSGVKSGEVRRSDAN